MPAPCLFICALNLGHRRQRTEDALGVTDCTLDNANQALEGRVRGIPQALVHPALARGDAHTRLGAQPVEGHDNLLPVAAADAVGNDVDAVAGVAQVDCGLGDANVRLDADEGNGRLGLELGDELGHQHGELGLVNRGRLEVCGDAGDGRAELGCRLGGCVDGDGGVLGKRQELLGRFYAVELDAALLATRERERVGIETPGGPYTLSNW